MNYIEQTLARIWGRILGSTSVDSTDLALFRIVFGCALLFLELGSVAWIGSVPDAFFDPPILSVANLFQGFPPAPVWNFIDIAYPVLAVFLILGVRVRLVARVLLFLCLFRNNFQYSFGKIDHEILTYLVLACLSFTNCGVRFSLVPDRHPASSRDSIAMGLLGVGIAFGLFSAGLEKAYIWIDFDLETSGFLSWYISGYYTLERTDFLAPYLLGLPAIVYELMDYTAVAFELSGFLFLIAGKRFWRVWLIGAGFFHLANLLILNIHFRSLIFVYGAFLFPMIFYKYKISEKLLRLDKRALLVLQSIPVVYCVQYLYRLLLMDGRSFSIFASTDDGGSSCQLCLPLVLWVLFVFVSLIAYLKPEEGRKP